MSAPRRSRREGRAALGRNQTIRTSADPVAPAYDDGTLFGTFRVLAGGHVDLTASFTDHNGYVQQITAHARDLQTRGYLLEADADAIIRKAMESDIGNP